MKADLCDFAEAIELPEAAGLLAESVPADDGMSLFGPASPAESLLLLAPDPSPVETEAQASKAYASGNPHPVRTIAFNVVRFASVLIGAGLLLRTGAAEQAISAIEEEKPQPERPVTTRLVLPQPAFGQDVQAGVADPARLAVPHATFAAAAATNSGVAEKTEIKADSAASVSVAPAPALAAFDSEFDKSATGKSMTASAQPARIAAASDAIDPATAPARAAPRVAPALSKTASTAALAVSASPKVAAVKAFSGPVSAPSLSAAPAPASARPSERAQISASAPSILSPTRRSTASGLLAPVMVVSRPVVAPVMASSSTGSNSATARMASVVRPVPAPQPAVASNLANAQPRQAFRPAAVAASMPAPAPRAPAPSPAFASSAAPTAAGTPGPAAPVKISLALPVMKPGPRTTLLTSDIRSVMRRPASAWDYAEALPPELTGRAGQRSASVEPQDLQAQQVAPVESVSQPGMTQSASVVAPIRSAQSGQALAGQASPSQDGRVVAQTQPQSLAQERASAQANRPVAQLDLPPAAQRLAMGLAMAGPRVHPAHAAAAKPALPHGKPVLSPKRGLDAKRKSDDAEAAALAGSAPLQESAQPSARAGTTAYADPVFLSGVSGDGAGTTAQLADASGASNGPEGSGLSLRDRLPRPAF